MQKTLYVPDYIAQKKKAEKQDKAEQANVEKAYVDAKSKVLDPSLLEKTLLERLPQPTGYRMLVIPYYVPEKVNGIIIPDKTRDRESFASVVAYVVKMGPDAYKDKDKFPTGAWCSEKDWVLMGRYAGNKFKVDGLELRIINDDNIIASILDPKDISYI